MFTYHQPAPISAMFAESRFGTFVDDALISKTWLADATGMRSSDVARSEDCCIDDIKIKNHTDSKRSKKRFRSRHDVRGTDTEPSFAETRKWSTKTKPKETAPKYLLFQTFPHGKTCRSTKVIFHETQRRIKRRRWPEKDAHDSWVLILDTVFFICCLLLFSVQWIYTLYHSGGIDQQRCIFLMTVIYPRNLP